MKRLIVIGALFLAGCESMPRGEMAHQTLHAIDILQTINGPADDDCYWEGAALTRRLIGEKPSRGQVLAWGVGKGALHYGVSKYLDNNAPSWALTAWQAVSTGRLALTIRHNYEIGVKPWGDNDHSKIPDGNFCSQ